MFKKAYLFLKRDIGHTLIVFLLLLAMSTFFMISILLARSALDMKMDVMRQIGAKVHLGPNPEYRGYKDPVLTDASEQQILEIPNVIGIEKMEISSMSDALPVDFHNSKQHSGMNPEEQEVDDGMAAISDEALAIYEDSVHVLGCSQIELYDDFRRNLSWLLEGEFPSAEHRGVMISKQLAEENELRVGDSIQLKPYERIMAGEERVRYTGGVTRTDYRWNL